MEIYFGGAIAGGRNDREIYSELINHLKNYGKVLTEHIGSKDIKNSEMEKGITAKEIHDRDVMWLNSADILIAEVTTPSLGVGYELGRAVAKGMKILCLYRVLEGKYVSGMIIGSDHIVSKEYKTIEEAKQIIDEFLKDLSKN